MQILSFVVVLVLLLVIVQADICNKTCIIGTRDLFHRSNYGDYGFPYVRSPSRPPVTTPQSPSITRGIVVIHGEQEDVNNYYCWVTWAAEARGMLESSYVIAPFFSSDNSPGSMFWDPIADWSSGDKSTTNHSIRISSFAVLDDIMINFANTTIFPSLTEILLTGHSAGSQTGQRYALSSNIDTILQSHGVSIRYIILNPGSYGYLDTVRAVLPLPSNTCAFCDEKVVGSTVYSFASVSNATATGCPIYNTWKMGLDNGNMYERQIPASLIRSNYRLKNVSYIIGNNDTCNDMFGNNQCNCNDYTLDTGCDAILQGYCRYQRGHIWYQYLRHFYGTEVHSLSVVDGVGHDGCRMLNSEVALDITFSGSQPKFATSTLRATAPTSTLASKTSSASHVGGLAASRELIVLWLGCSIILVAILS